MKEKAAKQKYSMAQNLRYVFGKFFRWNVGRTTLGFLRAPINVAIPFLGIYMSRTVVELVGGGADIERILWAILALAGGLAACMALRSVCDSSIEYMGQKASMRFQTYVMEGIARHDYEYVESKDGMAAMQKAMDATGSHDCAARTTLTQSSSLLESVVGLAMYAAMIFMLHPLIVAVIVVTTAANYVVTKRTTVWRMKHRDNWAPIDHKIGFTESAMKEQRFAKDIRLYSMSDWLRAMFDDVLGQRMGWRKREEQYNFKILSICGLLSLVREGAAYGLLIYAMYANDLSVADFVLYFGIIAGFSGWMDGVMYGLHELRQKSVSWNEYRAFLEHESKNNTGEGIPVPQEPFAMELRDVNYRFSGTDTDFITGFNLTIKKGERLAIVGPNGAGKTTLVKLLTGLYRPASGMILADGQPMDAYNINDYSALFAVVFQDMVILPQTIAQTIAAGADNVDAARLEEVLSLSGFSEKIATLAEGTDTYLLKGIMPGAIDLSGGEMQKLALARALYKGGQFLILDEPTAALDPIAESKVYERYNEMSGGKTAVFISHRLASTRFCDRILYIENGRVVEDGSHDALMQKGGKYAEMFEIQSHYYKEEVATI